MKSTPSIIVLTQGFIYYGVPRREGDFLVIGGDPKNIERWGTTKGLGELVAKGPTKDTILRPTNGEVFAPWHAVVSLQPVAKAWP